MAWEPDYTELEAINMQVNEYTVHVHPTLIRKIITELRRQEAAQGIVEIGLARIDTVLGILDALIPTANDEIDVDMLVNARDILAAIKDQLG